MVYKMDISAITALNNVNGTATVSSRIEWDRMTKKDAYGIPATFIIGGIIGILVSIFLK